jgi:RNA polymerase sigma-70 factor, ECF subfamily
MVKELILAEAQGLERAAGVAEQTFQTDEQAFRALYERTARPLWSYLYRASGSSSLADDLMQESYFRILRVRLKATDQEYAKNYLFRIATNLLRDHWRKGKSARRAGSSGPEGAQASEMPSDERTADAVQVQSDMKRVLDRLKPRERELLWLAYVEGSNHREIAEIVGLKEQSVRSLLFRARQKLASMLRSKGLGWQAK